MMSRSSIVALTADAGVRTFLTLTSSGPADNGAAATSTSHAKRTSARSEGPAKAQQDLQPARSVLAIDRSVDEIGVELVAEVDSDVPQSKAHADTPQPGGLRAGRRGDPARIEQPEELNA